LNKTGNYGIIKQNALAVSEEAVIYSEQTGLNGHYLSAGGGVEGDGDMKTKIMGIITIVLVATAGAIGDVTVNVTSYVSISNITTWPVAYTDASVANPSTYNVGENNYGGAPLYSLAQSWTATVSGPLTDIQIAISGTAPVNFNLNLYDGGTSGWADIVEGTYNPGVNVSNNLFSSSLAVAWTGYNNSGDTAAVLDFAFSSADGVAVTSGHQYIFEIASEDNPNGMFWYRRGPGSNYTGGQQFCQRSPIPSTSPLDFALAAKVVPEPASILLLGLGGLLLKKRS